VSIAHLPLAVRVALYFILADFGPTIGVHRLTTLDISGEYTVAPRARPTCIGWVERERPYQISPGQYPYVLAYSFLDISPWWMATAIAFQHPSK